MVRLATAASILGLLATAQAVQLTFENKCSYEVKLYDNNAEQKIAPGGTTVRSMANGSNGMFRHGSHDEATLAEFAVAGGKCWFDLSVVPPGGGYCKSHEHCKKVTGKTGYNVPMSIIPDTPKPSTVCRTLVCEKEDCPDAYLYPTDDLKTHNCPDNVPMKVVFCPSGSASQGNGNAQQPAPSQATAAPAATQATAAPAATQATAAPANNSSNAFSSDSNYESGHVSGKDIPSSGKSASFPNAQVKASFTYKGKLAGNMAGTYQMVTDAKTCSKQTVSVNSPVGPMSEEVTMVFRGPMTVFNVAVFDGSNGGDWQRVSSYAQNGDSQDLVFMNNKNIDYSGNKKSPQGFSTADGLKATDRATKFLGKLAEASNPSQVGGGPGIQTGAEVNIMRNTKCSSDKACKGYFDSNGHHGWNGGKKMFVTKVHMPTGSSPNQPAIWMLNAQVVRSSQYQCNCRGMGGVGGCGELDIAEVIETNNARDKVSTHYYFYDGSVPSGRDNFAPRPTNGPTTYLTIIDDEGEGTIQILEIGADDFDFSTTAVSKDQIKKWLNAGASSSSRQH